MTASGAVTGPPVALLLVTDRKTEAKVLGKLVLRVEPVSEVDATDAAVGMYLQYTHQRQLAVHFDYSHVVSWVVCRSSSSSSFNLNKMAQYKIKQCIKATWANR